MGSRNCNNDYFLEKCTKIIQADAGISKCRRSEKDEFFLNFIY